MARDGSYEHHGADPGVWKHFQKLGLTADLLPVAMHPSRPFSPDSTMSSRGKTPSRYNARGELVGIAKWSTLTATDAQVSVWSREPDFGVCLQTRYVRGFDIDVPDADLSEQIVEAIGSLLGVRLPKRFRVGTGKCLLAFGMEGVQSKGALTVEGGVVELLGNGQQFVVSGSHYDRSGPSGTRYEWEGGLPDEIPALSREQFAEVCSTLELVFGLQAWRWAGERRPAGGSGADLDGVTDEVALWLVENWITYGESSGKLLVQCPWEHEHTAKSGDTETSWLIAGTKGYEQGHFRCLHSHCLDRGREAFLTEVGYTAAGFDVIEAPAGKNGGVELHKPPFVTRKGAPNQGGGEAYKPILNNVLMALRHPDICGFQMAYDIFQDATLIADADGDVWRALRDTDETDINSRLQGLGFDPIADKLMTRSVAKIAYENRFDSAIRWLEGLAPWDGIERCGRFMADYMGCTDTPYAAAVGLYAWTAHAGRVMEAGCQADMVIALTGGQGQRKSASVAAIVPRREFALTNLSLHRIDDDLSRKMRGKLVAEIAELRGLNSTDADTIKAWITTREETWVPKFIEHSTIFLRRLVLWSTANENEFLADSTGERRWLPIEIERSMDDGAIARDRDQLWAEGLWRWRRTGVAWQDAERLAQDEHSKFKVPDTWEDLISDWLDQPSGLESGDKNTPRTGGGFRADVLARELLGIEPAKYGRKDAIRIGKILQVQGLKIVSRSVNGKTCKVWATNHLASPQIT